MGSRLKGTRSIRLTVLPVALFLVIVAAMIPVRPMSVQKTSAATAILAAAGDIACGPTATSSTPCLEAQTANLIKSWSPTGVLTLGDTQYECGALDAFQNYYDKTWGAFKSITYPSIGNHEYLQCPGNTAGAPGYFTYFGDAASPREPGCRVSCMGYYSADIGGVHVVAINSNCTAAGGCGSTSPQVTWLKKDLAASTATCTVAYWHHPRFSSGDHGNSTAMQTIWQTLYDAGVDIVLAGHDHNYERFAPMNGAGAADDNFGIRSFVVGTGGKNIRPMSTIQPNSAVSSSSLGAIKLAFDGDNYSWQYTSVGNYNFSDSGTGSCHGKPAATVGTATATATKAATSTPGTGATATTGPVGSTLFADGFESGGLTNWTTANGVTVSNSVTGDGAYSAKAVAAGGTAQALKTLPATATDVYYRIAFNINAKDATSAVLGKVRDASGRALVGVFLSGSNVLGVRNDVAALSTHTKTVVTKGVWHQLVLHVRIGSSTTTADDLIELTYDGVVILSQAANVGAAPVGRLQLGENQTGRNFTIYFDAIAASNGVLPMVGLSSGSTAGVAGTTDVAAVPTATERTRTRRPSNTPVPGATVLTGDSSVPTKAATVPAATPEASPSA